MSLVIFDHFRSAQAQPAINAAWDGDAIVKYKSVGLSVAIAIDDGLVTPVIKQAEKKTLAEISAAVKDLAAKAKNKKLLPRTGKQRMISSHGKIFQIDRILENAFRIRFSGSRSGGQRKLMLKNRLRSIQNSRRLTSTWFKQTIHR